MSSFPWLAHLSAQTWLAIGAVIILLGLLLVVRASRERNVVISSATADLIAYHLSRIADALDRGALDRVARSDLPRRELLRREVLRPNETPVEPVRSAEPRQEAPPPAPPAQVREPRHVGLSMFGR